MSDKEMVISGIRIVSDPTISASQIGIKNRDGQATMFYPSLDMANRDWNGLRELRLNPERFQAYRRMKIRQMLELINN
jgi:hypothetical protein